MMDHFTTEGPDDEFRCRCGICDLGFNDMKVPLLLRLQRARHISDCPYTLNSAMRCWTHNKNEGGSLTSSHPEGWAVDIATPNSVVRYRVLYGLILAGFNRIEEGINYYHVDCDPQKPEGIVFPHPVIKAGVKLYYKQKGE